MEILELERAILRWIRIKTLSYKTTVFQINIIHAVWNNVMNTKYD